MKRLSNFLFLALIAFSAHTLASDNPPAVMAPGGAWWVPKTVLRIEKSIALSEATRLDADEIIIANSIVTNGHPLNLHARRIEFKEGGRIDAFKHSAPEGIPGASYGAPAKAGATEGAIGDNGATGYKGNTGGDGIGADGKDLPGEILLFSAEIRGEPVINAQGQKGGTGGKGGQGQTGGTGGKGKDAVAKEPCLPWGDDWPADPGAQGGAFGKGGEGGNGGYGGAPVPFSILTAWREDPSIAFKQATASPGYGGESGIAGEPGAPGAGGAGGAGDSNSCWFFGVVRNVYSAGAGGPTGRTCVCPASPTTGLFAPLLALFTPNCECKEGDVDCIQAKCTAGAGSKGTVGEVLSKEALQTKLGRKTFDQVRTYREFETKRFNVSLAWYDFHWRRHFEDLLHGSIYLLDDLEVSESEQAASELSLDGAIHSQLIDTVKKEWERNVINPLSEEENRYKELPEVAARIAWAKKKALTFTNAMAEFQPNEPLKTINELKDIWSDLSGERTEVLKKVASLCKTYLSEVVQSPEFQTELKGTQYHFDIPACLELPLFSELQEGPMRPIVLVRDIEAFVPKSIQDFVKMSQEGPSDALVSVGAWNFLQSKIDEFFSYFSIFPIAFAESGKASPFQFKVVSAKKLDRESFKQAYPVPRSSSRVGKLGVNKGYLTLMQTKKTLPLISEQLYGLSRLVGEP